MVNNFLKFLPILIVAMTTTALKPLGAECQSTNECDDPLECVHGKCDCATEDMVFELTSDTCRLKAGESCSLFNRPGILMLTDGLYFGNAVVCVNGSECIDEICTCVDGMYTRSGLCMPQKGLDSTCNSDIECNAPRKLNCINGKCTCRTGFSITSRGLCGLAYGKECSKVNVCSDEFMCTHHDTFAINGDGVYTSVQSTECLCPNIELEIFDGNRCIGVIGGPCKPEIGCVKNARCGDYHVCNCQDGFIEHDLKNCDVAHGFACEPPSRDGDVIPCDRLGGLLCKQEPGESEFKCSCPNKHDVYHSDVRKCLRREYFTCKHDTECESKNCSFKYSKDSSGRC